MEWRIYQKMRVPIIRDQNYRESCVMIERNRGSLSFLAVRMKKFAPRMSYVLLLIVALFAPVFKGQAGVLLFNEEKVPRTTADLLAIQEALTENLEQARAATVGIKLEQGFGSAVIVSADGLILTAAHVSGGVDKELTVVMNDGTEFKAVSMGLISNTDAAMMRITDEDASKKLVEAGITSAQFPYVEINRENDYQLGHWVFALGHSGGFDQARGPVVRLGRIVQDKPTTLQTDCKVIGGDSGGPLFDMDGRLIGIHSRVGVETVVENMHVPMREYLKHWDEMENNEFVGDGPFAERPVKGSGFLGLGTGDTEEGLKVQKVGKGYAAEKAGFKVGDIILEIDGEAVADQLALKAALGEYSAGDKLEMKISREGKPQTIKVKLGKR